MQRLMLRLDAAVRRRRGVVIAAWVIALLAALPLAAQQSEHLTGGGFGVPGSESRAVEDALPRDFPEAGRGTLAVVVVPRKGATPERVRATLDEAAAAVARTADAAVPRGALERAKAAVGEAAEGGTSSRGGSARAGDAASGGGSASARAGDAASRGGSAAGLRPVVLPLELETDDLGSTDVAGDLRDRLDIADRAQAPVGLHLVGQGALWAGLQDLTTHDLEQAERTGFPLVALILVAVFGSLVAASLPLLLGAFSVLITGALIALLSRQLEMSVFVTSMASMIGIGVAVDYSLFVLARFREEVRAGRTPEAARATAMATSGLAVLFSGLTVVVALAGLLLVPTTALRSMALGAILVVLVSMLASATLLPALISAYGRRAYTRGRLFVTLELVRRTRAPRRRGSTRPDAPARPAFWERWTARVTRRPVLAAVAGAAVLLVLAIPALSLETGNGALRQFPSGHETVQGFRAAATLQDGPGAGSPVRVVVPAGQAAAARRVLERDGAVAQVAPPVRSEDGRRVLLQATLRTDGEAPAAKAAIVRLRDGLPAEADVGGATALQRDFADEVSGSMWKIVLFVLGLSFVVLLVLLRSVVLPLKAVVMNLLSVGAAYGVLVAVFQWGWADGFLGFESPGYLDTLTLPLVLAVVFGLSMDYEVFLLSRIRERYTATGDTRRAVAEGLASSARTITSAALIMVGVFLVFVGTGVPSIKQIGLGNAVAIAVDATVVRLVLVPAAMELLGRWNWWLPAPLGRVLPRADLEELDDELLEDAAARPRERAKALA